jgi:hypothetical protein
MGPWTASFSGWAVPHRGRRHCSALRFWGVLDVQTGVPVCSLSSSSQHTRARQWPLTGVGSSDAALLPRLRSPVRRQVPLRRQNAQLEPSPHGPAIHHWSSHTYTQEADRHFLFLSNTMYGLHGGPPDHLPRTKRAPPPRLAVHTPTARVTFSCAAAPSSSLILLLQVLSFITFK